MGNQQPKNSEDGLQMHQRLGTIRIIESIDKQTQQPISEMEIQKLVENQSNVNAWKAQIMRIDDSEARQILLLPIIHEFIKAGMCGSSGTLRIVYENLSYVLKGEIQNRFKINRFFQQKEIWYLLYNMIRAGNKFERIKKKVGNMHPNNILINDDGQIKIISTCSIPGEVDNFDFMAENHQGLAFLGTQIFYNKAPQQLANDSIQNAKYPPGVNPCLAQVFSIGMTILSAGTLLECDDIYERRKDSIKLNQNNLQSHLRLFKQRYSLFLSQVVSQMLAINPQNRKSSSQIYQLLYKYENEILDLQPFVPPQRYELPQQQQQQNVIRTSNYYPVNQPQISSSMIGSKVFSSNIYTPPQQQQHILPTIQINDSRMLRSSIPPRQVLTNSQLPGGQVVHMNEGLSYSSHYRPLMSPKAVQSGVFPQKQSKFIPANSSSSSVISGSFIPVRQSQIPTVGTNYNVVQSNYVPNYQFRP